MGCSGSCRDHWCLASPSTGFKSLFPLVEVPGVVERFRSGSKLINSLHIFVHISVHIFRQMLNANRHPVDRRAELVEVHVRLDLLSNPAVGHFFAVGAPGSDAVIGGSW